MHKFSIGIFSLAFAAFWWGSTFTFSKVLMQSFSPLSLLMVRGALTAFCMGIIGFAYIKRDFLRALRSQLFYLFCLSNFLGLLIQTISLKHTTAANTGFISATFVIMVPLLRIIHFKKFPVKAFPLILFVSLLGLYLISFNPKTPFRVNWGDLYALISAFFYAYFIVILEIISKEFSASSIVFFSFLSTSVLSAVTLMIVGENFPVLLIHARPVWLNMAGIVVLGGVIPYLLMAKGQRLISSTLASLIYLLEPVFAAGIAWIFLNERMEALQVFGAVIIFSSLVLGVRLEKRFQTLQETQSEYQD